MKKLFPFLLILSLSLGHEAFAQAPKNVTMSQVAATRGQISESLSFGTGKTGSFLSGSTLSIAGTLSGTPTGGTLDLSLLTLTLPATYLTAAQLVAVNGSGVNVGGLVDWSQLMNVPAGFADGTDDGAGGGAGTVTSFSAGDLSPLFTTSEATATTTPALTFTLSNAAQNAVFAGPATGGTGAPAYRALVAADIPSLTLSKISDAGQLSTWAGVTPGTGVATALGVNTGSAGAVVLFNGALGTPSSGTLTNATGLPVGTGISGFGTGVATFLATPSSANLATAITDETGTGAFVLANSPTLATPTLGVATATSLSTTRQSHGSAGATETFDRANGDTHEATLDANLTVTLTGWAASGKLSTMLIGLTQNGTGGWTVTWPAAVVSSPTVTTTAGAITWVSLWTTDGGTTIYASSTADGVPISSVSGLGTGVATALAVNVGSAGAPVVNGGALGTPSSGTLTNATGLPISTGVSGLGAGVATALAVNVGSSGAFVTNGGALGTPSSGTLTNATGLPISTGVSGLGTGIATALAINTGSAGAPVLFNGALGTPTSGTLTNATGLPVSTGISGLGTGTATALAVNAGSSGAFLRTSDRVVTFVLTIDDLADSLNYDIGFVGAAFTVTEIRGVHFGTGLSSPSIVATVKHGTDRTSGTTVEAVTVTSSTTGTSVTSGIDDATIPANSFIWVETASKSGTTDNMTIIVRGTYD